MTRYGKIDHSQFFMKIEFWVWIDAEFTVEFNCQEPGFKKVPKPSYDLKIAHGSPVSQFTIFRETEDFVRTLLNVQCFRIRSVLHHAVGSP